MSAAEVMDVDPEPGPDEFEPDSTAMIARIRTELPAVVSDALVLRREPNEMLAEATKAAKALMAVMKSKPDKVMMNGQQYIENDDWQTIGHFYGCTAQIESDRFVEFGDVKGWEAVAILVSRDGRTIGRATAMCLNDEEKWSSRPKKVWAYCLADGDDHSKHEHSAEDPGRERIVWEPNPSKPGGKRPRKAQIIAGVVVVPMFQLRSMAQTRASSKVHRTVLAFVPVLAGFSPTPAEELPDAERVSNRINQADEPKGYVVEAPRSAASSNGTTAALEAVDAGSTPAAAATDNGPDLATELPPGARLITKIELGVAGSKARIFFNAPMEHGRSDVLTFREQVAALAEELRQNKEPCFAELRQSAAGNWRVESLVRVPANYEPPAGLPQVAGGIDSSEIPF